MLIRHSAIAASMLCAFAPALAQDTGISAAALPPAVKATAAYPVRQDASQWLGSNLIGAKVKSASNEMVGHVANLVVNDNGAIEAAVIAIGGAFGFGRRNVAVTYKSLNFVRNPNGDGIDHITIAATKKDLSRAVEFKPLSTQNAERQAALRR
jgi:hypothetical protein